MRLEFGRLILICTLAPCISMWMSGKLGQVRMADIFVLLYCGWSALSLAAVYGPAESIKSSGMLIVESAGPYFLARACVRGPRQFRSLVFWVTLVVVVLLPFAIFEAVTRQNVLLDTIRSLGQTHDNYMMKLRWDLRRVQSVFEHPILFGVYCCSIFALTHMVLGRGVASWRRWLMSALVGCAVFLSLSSGPLSALVVQAFMILWGWLFSRFPLRWWVLAAPVIGAYVVVSLFSNQSFFEFYVHYFAFSQDTGWDRIRIWHYGWASVLNHPLFGIGYEEYQRPEWMEPSIDMFWLINFVRFGILSGVFMFMAFLSTWFAAVFAKGLSGDLAAYRTAYVITLVGLFVVGWTVHFWGSVYLLFMFLMGSSAWLLDSENAVSARGKPVPAVPVARKRLSIAVGGRDAT